MSVKAVVTRSNNRRYPVGTEVAVEKVYYKFYSQTFGRFFLIKGLNEYGVEDYLTCNERRCGMLYGGNWELKEEIKEKTNKIDSGKVCDSFYLAAKLVEIRDDLEGIEGLEYVKEKVENLILEL